MATPTIEFSDGLSLGPGHCRVIGNPLIDGETPDDPPMNSFLFEWSQATGLTAMKIPCPVTRITASADPAAPVFISGRLGFIGVVSDGNIIEETIEGPQDEGFIRDLRVIGHSVYAVGMGRQIYQRAGPGDWKRFAEGIPRVPAGGDADIMGFNSLDGITEDDLYAVGFGGEIWRCVKGQWRNLKSPTKLILERVRAVKPGLAFAAGQQGVLLRGNGDAWEPITHKKTTDDIWGIEWFQDRLYVATEQGLFRLNAQDELERIDPPLANPSTYSSLHAAQGTLWSFGSKNLIWTTDGELWHAVVLNEKNKWL